MLFLFSLFVTLFAVSHAQTDDVVDAPPANWYMEGGSHYREGFTAYDGTQDARGQARYFYSSLSDGSTYCDKPRPDTASATPILFNDVWIVADCVNQLIGFAAPDLTSAAGGALARLWTWKMPYDADFPIVLATEPLLATPVINRRTGIMYVLYKGDASARLYALQLPPGGTSAPSPVASFGSNGMLELWKITSAPNLPEKQISFADFNADHSIFFYGGKVWVPSNDFDGALVVDGLSGSYIVTCDLYDETHRLQGSVASAALGWTAPIFVSSGSLYGLQAFDPNTGNRTFWSDNRFTQYADEFQHPVAVRFESYYYGVQDCIIATSWDTLNDIRISGIDANSSLPCGNWQQYGYNIRKPYVAMPLWVSPPAVLYDGYERVYLIFAVVLPSGDNVAGRRSAWTTTLVSIQIDRTGAYTDPVDYFTMTGLRFNTAPVVIRDAWGAGSHAIAVGGTDGNLHIFPAKGFGVTGPVISHGLDVLLPPPNNPAYPGADNSLVGVSGTYMAASTHGSIGFIAHNPSAEMNWFGLVVGAMYPLATDVTPTSSPKPRYQTMTPSASPAAGSASNAQARAEVDVAGAVLGSLGGIAALAAAIVVFLPHSGAAKAIKGLAGGMWGGVKAVAGSVAPKTTSLGGAYTSASSGATAPLGTGTETAGLLRK